MCLGVKLPETSANGKGDSSQPIAIALQYKWIKATAPSPPEITTAPYACLDEMEV